MFYIADLHVHSHYSRATSKNLNLESLYQWARIKGIHLVGTGDFTHPQWFQELKEKLVPEGNGLFRLKDPPKMPAMPGIKVHDIDVRFCLSTEISSIYKHGDKVRKNHNLLYAPDLDTVARINARLGAIGNLKADGRPILGLPARDLLEIALETSEQAYLVPAHVWTPWFSTLGSKGGYDSVEDCFRDLTPHIFALETGLSSDPEMNWKWSALDRYTLVSNSDAHSPQKLGREANILDTELSYDGLFNAFKTKEGFLGTYEFFPEEGKYHLDGHRNCQVVLDPKETVKHKGRCPNCGKPLTIGVLYRVEQLADRSEPQRPRDAKDFHYIIPLPEILSEINRKGPATKTVMQAYQQAVSTFGNEFTLLKQTPIEDIKKQSSPILAEAIKRMREQAIHPQPGYDGVYGVIKVFDERELDKIAGQLHFFNTEAISPPEKRQTPNFGTALNQSLKAAIPSPLPELQLNAAQEAVKNSVEGATIVMAAPGTGKTHTLTQWIIHQVETRHVKPGVTLAVTFTNKAAAELKERLLQELGDKVRPMQIGTFHAIAYKLLQERYPEWKTVYDSEGRKIILSYLFPDKTTTAINQLANALGAYFELGKTDPSVPGLKEQANSYRQYLAQHQAVDLADIIQQLIDLWTEEPEWLNVHRDQYDILAIDEFQDINPMQYRFIQMLARDKTILAIGDPNQAIYGFRGADVQLFFRFQESFQARSISLDQNYRSVPTILEAAHQVILHNSMKNATALIPNRSNGSRIQVHEADDEEQEARYIIQSIEKYVGGTENLTIGTPSQESYDYGFSDMAILCRTNAVSKTLAGYLKRSGIPVHYGDATLLLSQPPFDLLATILQIYTLPHDPILLHRVLTQITAWSKQEVNAFMQVLPDHEGDWRKVDPVFISPASKERFEQWKLFYDQLPYTIQHNGLEGAIRAMFDQYLPDKQLTEEQLLKKETILIIAQECQADLDAFLERMVLNAYTEVSQRKTDGVYVLTFHAAKGLEFPVVFVAGAEEGITPIQRKDVDLEEERRLFYVALTRAKDKLHLTYTQNRSLYGQSHPAQPSRFLDEIPEKLLEKVVVRRKSDQEISQMSIF